MNSITLEEYVELPEGKPIVRKIDEGFTCDDIEAIQYLFIHLTANTPLQEMYKQAFDNPAFDSLSRYGDNEGGEQQVVFYLIENHEYAWVTKMTVYYGDNDLATSVELHSIEYTNILPLDVIRLNRENI